MQFIGQTDCDIHGACIDHNTLAVRHTMVLILGNTGSFIRAPRPVTIIVEERVEPILALTQMPRVEISHCHRVL